MNKVVRGRGDTNATPYSNIDRYDNLLTKMQYYDWKYDLEYYIEDASNDIENANRLIDRPSNYFYKKASQSTLEKGEIIFLLKALLLFPDLILNCYHNLKTISNITPFHELFFSF